jgi:N-acetylmuramoyl-L-alanine amidase
MGFIGGQRPFSVGAALLTALIGVGVVATATEPIGVSLPELAEAHALAPTRDRITGVVTLRGEAGVVRLCPGLATIAVNGRAIALDRPVSVHSGVIYVEPGFASRLAQLLAERTAVPGPVPGAAPGADATSTENQPAETAAAPTTKPAYRWRVVIDAGHGGPFDGTIGPTGLKEKALTLPLARMLGARLEAMGIEVIQTRLDEDSLSHVWSDDLDLRIAVAERAEPDLFLSLHFNSAPSESVQGFELHVPRTSGGGPAGGMASDALAQARDEGRRAAEAIRGQLRELLDTPDRGLKTGRKRLVYKTGLPAVLIEYAFISNRESEQRYRDPAALERLADATARGVREFLAAVPPRTR